jgi:hypothetical protein
MAVAFGSATTVTGTSVSSLTVAVPAGTANGDVLLLFGTNSQPTDYSTPTGWTLLDKPVVSAVGESALYYRVASGEPASYILSTSSGCTCAATIVRYTGASASPVRSHTSATPATGTSGTAAAPAGVTGTDMVVHFYGVDEASSSGTDAVLTPPGGAWNTRVNLTASKGGGGGLWSASIAVIDQIGSSGTPAVTSNRTSGFPICSVALVAATVSSTPASGPIRRFDPIEKVVRDDRRSAADTASTVLARLGALRFPRVVAATSEVTTPYTGQIIFNTTDNMLYRYDGSTWVAFLATGGGTAATAHEARYEQTTLQGISNATDSKLQLNTAVTTCSDVVASGTGNQDFALNRGGVWRCSAGVRFATGTTGERDLFMATGTAVGTLANRFVGASTSGSTLGITLSVSTDIRVASGTSVFAGVFQNNGGSLNTDVAFGHTIHAAFTWLRP